MDCQCILGKDYHLYFIDWELKLGACPWSCSKSVAMARIKIDLPGSRFRLEAEDLPHSCSLLSPFSVFSDMDMQTRHMALSSLFTEALMMMNNASVTTAESLRGSLRRWTDTKVHGLLVLPLLTAACQSLASVRHMAETTEACIAAYFSEGKRQLLALSFMVRSEVRLNSHFHMSTK